MEPKTLRAAMEAGTTTKPQRFALIQFPFLQLLLALWQPPEMSPRSCKDCMQLIEMHKKQRYQRSMQHTKHPSPLFCIQLQAPHTTKPAQGRVVWVALQKKNRTWGQSGRKKGLFPQECKTGADISVSVPNGPTFPSAHCFIEARQKVICRLALKKQIVTSGIQLQGLQPRTAEPG